MGCASGKAANEVVGTDVGMGSRTTSAIKGGVQSFDVKQKKLSVAYKSKELKDENSGEPSPTLSRRASECQFERSRLGTHTLHGVMPGPKKGDGAKAKINQDRGVVCWPFAGSYNEALLCIFDGHGSRGERASEFCMERLPQLLEQSHAALLADPADALSKAFVECDELLRTDESSTYRRHMEASGTTATVLYMHGAEVWVAWVGDSRAIKASSSSGRPRAVVAEDLTSDHKPEVAAERARIEQGGGQVEPVNKKKDGGALRVWKDGQVGLGMTRSIGDGALKPVGVIAAPEVRRFPLRGSGDGGAAVDNFVIVASDGVWEFISSQEASDVIAASPDDATRGCEQLVLLAKERWAKNEGNNRDDISAIVAFLPFLEEDEPIEDQRPSLASPGSAQGPLPMPVDGTPPAAIAADDKGAATATPVSTNDIEPRLSSSPRTFDSPALFVNAGAVGIERMTSFEQRQNHDAEKGEGLSKASAPSAEEEEEEEEKDENFFSRRASVYNPYDGNDENLGLSNGAVAL